MSSKIAMLNAANANKSLASSYASQTLLAPSITASSSGGSKSAALNAQMVIAGAGPKSSERFVRELGPLFTEDMLTAPEMQAFYEGFRSYSLLDEASAPAGRGFETVMATSLAKSKENLRQLKVSDDLIESSRPRIAYKERGMKIQAALQRVAWGKIDQRLLNWGTIAQLPWFKEYAATIAFATLNKTRPPYQPAFYLASFWSNLEWDQAQTESYKRMQILLCMCSELRDAIDKKEVDIRIDVIGKVVHLGSKGLFGPRGYFDGSTLVMLDWNNTTELNKVNPSELTPGALLDLSVLFDPRKLLQNKDYKTSKNTNKGLHDERKRYIVELCRLLIHCSVYLGKSVPGDALAGQKVSLGVGSSFVRTMYECYNHVHTFVRSLKRELYGIAGGPDTRSADENEMVEVSGAIEDVARRLVEGKPLIKPAIKKAA